MGNIKIRCSMISQIIVDSRTKSSPLSDTANSSLRIYLKNLYSTSLNSKVTRKRQKERFLKIRQFKQVECVEVKNI